MSDASRALALLLLLVPAACISLAPRSRAAGEEAIVIENVPARRWSDNSCAAGALSEALNALGHSVSEEALSGSMTRAAHGGVVTVDLLLEARRRGFDAQLVRGDSDLIRRELSLRRPLILMLRVLDAPGTRDDLYHYVVLSGIDRARALVYLHYGNGAKRWVELRSLEGGWAAGGYATFLIGRKTRSNATPDDLARAVLLEEEGKLREAIALLRFYLESHPEDAAAWTNLGNSQMKAGEMGLAEVAYRNALFLAGHHVAALNNLAWLLLQENRLDEAETLARRAVSLSTHDRAATIDTLDRILAARQ